MSLGDKKILLYEHKAIRQPKKPKDQPVEITDRCEVDLSEYDHAWEADGGLYLRAARGRKDSANGAFFFFAEPHASKIKTALDPTQISAGPPPKRSLSA